MITKVGVIGGTGMLGKPVVNALLQGGFTVSAFVRDVSKAKNLLPKAVQLIPGDIRDRESLRAFLKLVDAIHLNLNLLPDEKPTDFHTESDGLKIILEECKSAEIKHISFISSLVMRYQGMNNFHWWVFDVKRNAIDQLKKSQIPYTIFYPSSFMENFEGNYRQGNRMMLAGTSLHKMYYISADDYARQVAQSLKQFNGTNNEFVIQGPEAYRADEAVAEYVKHYSKEKLTIAKAPLGMLKLFSVFSPKLRYTVKIIEALNNYPEHFEAANTWKLLGKPEITIRKFAEMKSQLPDR